MSFHLVPGAVVADVLVRSCPLVLWRVADANVAHETRATTLGPSAFLRIPERHARIIALSAHVRVPTQRVRMKVDLHLSPRTWPVASDAPPP